MRCPNSLLQTHSPSIAAFLIFFYFFNLHCYIKNLGEIEPSVNWCQSDTNQIVKLLNYALKEQPAIYSWESHMLYWKHDCLLCLTYGPAEFPIIRLRLYDNDYSTVATQLFLKENTNSYP